MKDTLIIGGHEFHSRFIKHGIEILHKCGIKLIPSELD